MDDLVQRVYRAFSPSPLTPEQHKLYVDLDEVRGAADVVTRLKGRIQLAEQPTYQVLAGHKGSGKSTELYRLKHALETASPPYFVVFCRADDDLDRNDVDFPDVLVMVIRQLAAQIKPLGIKLKPSYFQDRWERLKDLLFREVEFTSLELDAGLGKLGAAIKASPDSRLRIRELMDADAGNWLVAANEVIGQAVLELAKKQYAGLVILVDDLDKMVIRPIESTGCMTDEYLFVNRAAQLTAFRCHLIYTMPISQAYSRHEPTIAANYGGDVFVVPMTSVITRPPQVRPDPRGVRKFHEVIDARLQSAKAASDQVFHSPDVPDELIRLSGGQPSELMNLVREAIVAKGMPIDLTSLDRIIVNRKRAYARQLMAEHWPILREIRDTGGHDRSGKTDELFRGLLNS